MRARLFGTAFWQETNIQSTAQLALSIASDIKTETTVTPLSQDFTADWIDNVKNISDPILQTMWAQILAQATLDWDGRAPKPVVDLLKQFDVRIAVDFECVAQQLRSTNVIPKGMRLYDTPMAFNLEMLNDIGILSDTKRDYFWVPTAEGIQFTRSKITRRAGLPLPCLEFRERASELAKWLFPELQADPSRVRHFFKYPAELARLLSIYADGRHRVAFSVKNQQITPPNFEIQVDDVSQFGEGSDSIDTSGDPKMFSIKFYEYFKSRNIAHVLKPNIDF